YARGSLIARMDADDVSHPERLSRQRAVMLAQPDIGVLGTRVRAVGSGELGGGLVRYVEWQNSVLSAEEHRVARFIESPLCHPSMMIRRSVFDALEGYRAFDG